MLSLALVLAAVLGQQPGPDAGAVPAAQEAPPAAPEAGGPQPAGDVAPTDDPRAAEASDAADADASPEAGASAPDQTVTPPDEGGARAGAPVRETTVIGHRVLDVRRVAGSAQLIGREALERQESNDINRVLQGVPGVYVREEDGFGLRPNIGLRGVNADRSGKVTLMEDGVLLGPAPYSAPAAYYTPLVTRMVAMEVYKGPASIEYGPQTIGGAINYRTRPVPTQPEADLDLSVGNHGSGKAHLVAGWGTGRWGVLAEGVHLESTGFKQLDGGGDTGFSKNEAMLKGAWSSDPSRPVRNALELKLGFATERSNETYLGLASDDFEATPLRRYAASRNDQMNWWRSQVVLTHRLAVRDWLEVVTSAWRQDFERNWLRFDHFASGPAVYDVLAYPVGTNAVFRAVLAGDEDSVGPEQRLVLLTNHRIFINEGVQSAATARFATGRVRHEVELGLRFHHDEIRRHHDGHLFDMRNATLVPAGVPEVPYAHNVAWTRAFAAYLAERLSWGRLLVSAGARLEVTHMGFGEQLTGFTSDTGAVVPLAGLGAVYGFDSGLSLLAGVHQGYSPVTPGQDPSIRPERAVNSEAGLRFRRRGLRVEAIGFWSEYQNITGECTGSTGCSAQDTNRQFNGGQARVLGVELQVGAQARLPRGVTLAGELAYTFTSAHFLTDFSSANPMWGDVEAGDELPYIPMHQGQLRVRVRRGPVELGLGGMYYGEVREVAGLGDVPDAERVPARVLLDATASVEFGAARVYLTATNLLNSPALVARRPMGARPQAPLLVQLGLKYALR